MAKLHLKHLIKPWYWSGVKGFYFETINFLKNQNNKTKGDRLDSNS